MKILENLKQYKHCPALIIVRRDNKKRHNSLELKWYGSQIYKWNDSIKLIWAINSGPNNELYTLTNTQKSVQCWVISIIKLNAGIIPLIYWWMVNPRVMTELFLSSFLFLSFFSFFVCVLNCYAPGKLNKLPIYLELSSNHDLPTI